MNNTARLTVSIPAYDRPNLLEQALYSLCNQGLKKEDYVVAISDDASPNETMEIAKQFEDRLQIIYRRNPKNVGHLSNFEIAASMTNTPYVSFLPDDDIIAPGQLYQALSILEKHKSAVLVASPVIVQNCPGAIGSTIHGIFLNAPTNNSYSEYYFWKKSEWFALALINTPMSIIGAIFRRDDFSRCKLWKSYPLWHDRLMLAEVGLFGDVISMPWVGGYYRLSKHQLSKQLANTQKHEYREVSSLIWNLCLSNNIATREFWIDKICKSTKEERFHYLRMLRSALEDDYFFSIKNCCETQLGYSLKMGRLEKLGIPHLVAEWIRIIERRLNTAS